MLVPFVCQDLSCFCLCHDFSISSSILAIKGPTVGIMPTKKEKKDKKGRGMNRPSTSHAEQPRNDATSADNPGSYSNNSCKSIFEFHLKLLFSCEGALTGTTVNS